MVPDYNCFVVAAAGEHLAVDRHPLYTNACVVGVSKSLSVGVHVCVCVGVGVGEFFLSVCKQRQGEGSGGHEDHSHGNSRLCGLDLLSFVLGYSKVSVREREREIEHDRVPGRRPRNMRLR